MANAETLQRRRSDEAMAEWFDEFLELHETLGGYIFKCSNRTLGMCLQEQIFGSSERYQKSVEAITPGIHLFLFNCTTRRLHGVFEATDSGGYNIEPNLEPNRIIPGISFYPAQVRVRWYEQYQPLAKDITRTVMHNLRFRKNIFRVELTVDEALSLMNAFRAHGIRIE